MMKKSRNIFKNSTKLKCILGKLHILLNTTSSIMICLGCSWNHWIMLWFIIMNNKGKSNMWKSQECLNFNSKNKKDNVENNNNNSKMNSNNNKICNQQMDINQIHKNKSLQPIHLKEITHQTTRNIEKVLTRITSMQVYPWIIS